MVHLRAHPGPDTHLKRKEVAVLELALLTVATAVVVRELRRLEEKLDGKYDTDSAEPGGPGNPAMDTDNTVAEEAGEEDA
jgi:hypothetical protein